MLKTPRGSGIGISIWRCPVLRFCDSATSALVYTFLEASACCEAPCKPHGSDRCVGVPGDDGFLQLPWLSFCIDAGIGTRIWRCCFDNFLYTFLEASACSGAPCKPHGSDRCVGVPGDDRRADEATPCWRAAHGKAIHLGHILESAFCNCVRSLFFSYHGSHFCLFVTLHFGTSVVTIMFCC